MGCKLRLQRLIYKPTKKLFSTQLKNPNLFLNTNIFKSHSRFSIALERKQWKIFQHLRKPLWPVNNSTKARPKKNKYIKKPKHQTVLRHDTV